MKQSMFIFLLISGLCILCSCLGHQYHYVDEQKNWTDAQKYCRENYTDLATIDDEEDDMMMPNKTGSGCAWIGLHRSPHWQWSLADRDRDRRGEGGGEESLNLPWESNEPNNKGNNETCVTMRHNGNFHDFSCDQRFSFICYDENSTKRYIDILENKTWTEAQSYCRQKHTDLVSVRNHTEKDEVKKQLKVQGVNWWIGLYKNWKWSDQSKSSYRNWATTSDDLKGKDPICTAVSSGEWKEKKCEEKCRFICYDDTLILVKENMTWDEALTYCRQHHDDLVSVSTETLQHWVKRRAEKASTSHVWLGLRFSCTLRFWFWVSSEGLCYENWASGYPGTECGRTGAVESRNRQKWVSLPETERLNFICSK